MMHYEALILALRMYTLRGKSEVPSDPVRGSDAGVLRSLRELPSDNQTSYG